MDDKLKKTLEYLKFKPYGVDTMRCLLEDVEFVAIAHPFNKIFVLISTYHSKRNHGQIEENVPVDASVQDIAKILAKHFEQHHSVEKKENKGKK